MATVNRKLKTFYANLQVTRVEDWCVEAETAEQAKELLASGHGHRCSPGGSIHAELTYWRTDQWPTTRAGAGRLIGAKCGRRMFCQKRRTAVSGLIAALHRPNATASFLSNVQLCSGASVGHTL